MNEQQFKAAEELHHQLGLVICACVFEHPYAPRGKLVQQCGPCRVLRQWERVRGVVQQQPPVVVHPAPVSL